MEGLVDSIRMNKSYLIWQSYIVVDRAECSGYSNQKTVALYKKKKNDAIRVK